jgi:hypothetical protein
MIAHQRIVFVITSVEVTTIATNNNNDISKDDLKVANTVCHEDDKNPEASGVDSGQFAYDEFAISGISKSALKEMEIKGVQIPLEEM